MMYGDAGFSSYMIAKRFIDFTDAQILAIFHGSKSVVYTSDIYSIMENVPLVALTKMADLAYSFTGGSK